ncbi:MAG: hypothetical protein NTY64_20255 [Deltaproteobacteria bacterium]|nr:hypothetical protein [Deltaproteobacteria bacterium]
MRFTFVAAAYPPSTPHSSGYARRVPRNAGELFTNPSLWRLFTRPSNLVFFLFSCAALTADSLNPDTKISARIASFSGEDGMETFSPPPPGFWLRIQNFKEFPAAGSGSSFWRPNAVDLVKLSINKNSQCQEICFQPIYTKKPLIL